MPEVTNELMYELLEIVAIRLAGVEHATDVNNIYAIAGRIDQHLERIEQRLELRELAEAQRPYEPK
ncbi:hypothetical protein AB0V79_17720 [Mesorhizobium ciceri]|uniref:hypothetical protein n=1 Tax=Mesorhizobium ciceri TaxID=39645 RepID=UPI0007A94BBE|nr:hypothetical protein [Mesorhizobium ciceri]AMY03538.1 hypothetical protein A4R29_11695 [Mesorhizobium ciceri biovar biserrulae]